MKKRLFIVILIIIFSSLQFSTLATTISDYQSQQQKKNEEKKSAEEDLKNLQNEKKSVQEEVSNLNESISEVQANLSDLNDKIEKLDDTIKLQQKDLDEKEKLLEERLVISYMNGKTTYLDALLSGGIVNFISNYETIKQIVEYDNNLIEEVKQGKEQLELEKQELEDSKNKITEDKSKLEKTKQERENKVKLLSEEEQAAQRNIEEKENELARINEVVKKEQKRIEEERKKKELEELNKKKNESNSNNKGNNTTNNTNKPTSDSNVSPTTSGSMSWPTRITHKINSIYAPGGRSDTSGYIGTAHKGLDIYAPSGTPIYPAKSGTVVYVNNKGYGGGWGLYVVIYHGTDSNGKALYTRYAHASSIASGISVGTKVTTDTVIMYAGATGAAEGAHLHFEVCLNNMYNQVNPCTYLGVSNARGTY